MPSISHSSRGVGRPSGGHRIFAADDGRLWNASLADGGSGALIFVCVTDARERPRALEMEPHGRVRSLADEPDERLRDWLRAAPLLGTLS